MDAQLRVKFPKFFDNKAIEDYFFNLKEWVLLKCDALIEETDRLEKKIKVIDQYFEELNRPKNFDENDINSVINQYEKSFNNLSVMIQNHTPTDVMKISIERFYSILEGIYNSRPKTKF